MTVSDKIKELVHLARQRGHLTYGDINRACPDTVHSPEDLEEIVAELRGLEIQILDEPDIEGNDPS